MLRGPYRGAGDEGGRIVAGECPADVMTISDSKTAPYLKYGLLDLFKEWGHAL
ncbi:MAG: hypothetical protein WA419_11405 [Silvibacterium sp.]